MSRAFVKEDVEMPERSTRRRASSGLPPGALNYLTAAGAQQLQARLTALRQSTDAPPEDVASLEAILASATIVEPQPQADAVTFGVAVTLEDPDGQVATYRVAGVDEVDLQPGNVSWVSDLGKLLLSASLGQKLRLPGGDPTLWTVTKIG